MLVAHFEMELNERDSTYMVVGSDGFVVNSGNNGTRGRTCANDVG